MDRVGFDDGHRVAALVRALAVLAAPGIAEDDTNLAVELEAEAEVAP
jgi:hypothetical protein